MAAQINAQLETGAPAALSFEPITVEELQRRWLEHHEHVLRSSLHTIRRYRTATLTRYGINLSHLRRFGRVKFYSGCIVLHERILLGRSGRSHLLEFGQANCKFDLIAPAQSCRAPSMTSDERPLFNSETSLGYIGHIDRSHSVSMSSRSNLRISRFRSLRDL
jgi:hypothetical protein